MKYDFVPIDSLISGQDNIYSSRLASLLGHRFDPEKFEPVGVAPLSQGKFYLGDGHHRVKLIDLINRAHGRSIHIPIKIADTPEEFSQYFREEYVKENQLKNVKRMYEERVISGKPVSISELPVYLEDYRGSVGSPLLQTYVKNGMVLGLLASTEQSYFIGNIPSLEAVERLGLRLAA